MTKYQKIALWRFLISAAGAAALLMWGTSAASAGTNGSGPVPVPGMVKVTSIACPTASTCVIVGMNQSGVLTTAVMNPTTEQIKAGHIYGASSAPAYLACPGATACYTYSVSSIAGSTVSLLKISAGTGAVTVTGKLTAPKNGAVGAEGVSCAGSAGCWYSGFTEVTATNPLLAEISGAGTVLKTEEPGTGNGLEMISCESGTTCLAVSFNSAGVDSIVSLVNGKLGKPVSLGANVFIHDLSCFGTKLCYALGGIISSSSNANMLWPLNPATGAHGNPITVSNFNGLRIDCFSDIRCIAAGSTTAKNSSPSMVTVTSGKSGKPLVIPGLGQSFNGVGGCNGTRCFVYGATKFNGSTAYQGYVLRVVTP